MSTQSTKNMSFPIYAFFDPSQPCLIGPAGAANLETKLREWSTDHLHSNDSTLTGGYIIPYKFEKTLDNVKVTFSDEVKTITGYGISMTRLEDEAWDFIIEFLENEDPDCNDYRRILEDFIEACERAATHRKDGSYDQEEAENISKACEYLIEEIDNQLYIHKEYESYRDARDSFWNSLARLSSHLKNRENTYLLTSEYVPETKEIIMYTEAIHQSDMAEMSDFSTAFTAAWVRELFHAYHHMSLEENHEKWRNDQNFQVVSESLAAWFECEYIKYCIGNDDLAKTIKKTYVDYEPAVWPASAMTGIKHHRDFEKVFEMSLYNMDFACVAVTSYKYWDELSELNMDLGKMYYRDPEIWY